MTALSITMVSHCLHREAGALTSFFCGVALSLRARACAGTGCRESRDGQCFFGGNPGV